MTPDESINILGGPLAVCGSDPVTGFFRDGSCNTCAADQGSHTVCAIMTAEFLAYSKYVGNDLSTPIPEFQFPGVAPGDQWCLCAARWQEAFLEGNAPAVVLEATHARALEICRLEDLQAHAFVSGS
ncbi:DUF2237 domain-containing protein [uncultured Sulfitobacter sp.]|uniref:DUF2237 family protein n=1 Tax=uncultured Sulfitobacter sp. TaxID=191468 RepID=UPI002591F68E|nr:DUF2237 domain-containing protein [uncultured Sulfitobacter sp.]